MGTVLDWLQGLSALATVIQTLLAVRQAMPEQAKEKSRSGANSAAIYLSRRRFYLLIASVVLTASLCVLGILSPKHTFSMLESDKLMPVTNQDFLNETVLIDGKDFENCKFSGVTLVYEGRHNFKMIHSNFYGPVKLSWTPKSAGRAGLEVTEMLRSLNMVDMTRVNVVNDSVVLLPPK